MAKIALIKTDSLDPMNCVLTVPLGALYLSALAKQRGHEVKVYDLSIVHFTDLQHKLHEIAESHPDIIGFSSLSTQYYVHKLVSRYLRMLLPGALFITGGPLASSEREDLLKDEPQIDISAVGEAENTFLDLLEWREKGGSLADIKGICYRENGEVLFTGPGRMVENVNELPMPDYEQIDYGVYSKFLSASQLIGRRNSNIFTSRGCPYNCGYCHNVFGKNFRARSPESVMEEMRYLRVRHGVVVFEIWDDIFNFDYDRAMEILQRIRCELPDVKIGFPNGIRLNNVDEKLIEAMARANCYLLAIPVDTYSKRTQKMINRKVPTELVREITRWTRKHGVYTWGYYMVGFPGETQEEMALTFKYAEELDIDYPLFFQVTPFKNTKIASEVQVRGMPLPDLASIEYFHSVQNYSDTPMEYISQQRGRQVIRSFRKPQNWYMVVNRLYWVTQWMGSREFARELAMSATRIFAGTPRNMLETDQSNMDRRKKTVLKRLESSLGAASHNQNGANAAA